mmetsp:Transcript_23274/g.40202  ORF Transcript_23274/g.40202 Transcript_23274/m.40202 type:complete len:103 (+) Transcript_23274:1842-2150(+)
MNTPAQPPVFLERRSYRQRRMMDALRLLPVLGVLLWLFPLFWPASQDEAGGAEPMTMSAAVIYVFVVWMVLIAASFALRRILRPTFEQQATDQGEADPGEAH